VDADELDSARQAILGLLGDREAGKTICPSEAARQVAGREMRDLMPTVRAAAAQLAGEEVIDVTQRGRVVDPATARGPIRLRLRRAREDRPTPGPARPAGPPRG